jgi:hypothetical protein
MILQKQVHIYHYTTPCETVICDSDGVTGVVYLTNTNFFIEMLAT